MKKKDETGPFSPENVAKAVGRIPETATRQLRRLLDLARERGLGDLADACEAELAIRPVEFDSDAALRHVRAAERTAGMDLRERIEFAFTELPPSPAEVRMAKLIHSRPGISFSELTRAVGKGDSGLVIGHFVYDRFGAFRAVVPPGEPQSGALFERAQTANGMCYTMRPETEAAFRALGII